MLSINIISSPSPNLPLLSSLKVPPASVEVKLGPDQEVRAGRPVTLECKSSTSYPVANVTWWRGSKQLLEGRWHVGSGAHGGTVTTLV